MIGWVCGAVWCAKLLRRERFVCVFWASKNIVEFLKAGAGCWVLLLRGRQLGRRRPGVLELRTSARPLNWPPLLPLPRALRAPQVDASPPALPLGGAVYSTQYFSNAQAQLDTGGIGVSWDAFQDPDTGVKQYATQGEASTSEDWNPARRRRPARSAGPRCVRKAPARACNQNESIRTSGSQCSLLSPPCSSLSSHAPQCSSTCRAPRATPTARASPTRARPSTTARRTRGTPGRLTWANSPSR